MVAQTAFLFLEWSRTVKDCIMHSFEECNSKRLESLLINFVHTSLGVPQYQVECSQRTSSLNENAAAEREYLLKFIDGFVIFNGVYLAIHVSAEASVRTLLSPHFCEGLVSVSNALVKGRTIEGLADVVSSLIYLTSCPSTHQAGLDAQRYITGYLSIQFPAGHLFLSNSKVNCLKTDVGLTLTGFVIESTELDQQPLSITFSTSYVFGDLDTISSLPALKRMAAKGCRSSSSGLETPSLTVHTTDFNEKESSFTFETVEDFADCGYYNLSQILFGHQPTSSPTNMQSELLLAIQKRFPVEVLIAQIQTGDESSTLKVPSDWKPLKAMRTEGSACSVQILSLQNSPANKESIATECPVRACWPPDVKCGNQPRLELTSAAWHASHGRTCKRSKPTTIIESLPSSIDIPIVHVASPSSEKIEIDGLSCVFQQEANALRRFIRRSQPDHAVMLVNTQKIIDQYNRWRLNLPRVEPFYAVKCNGDLAILKTLADLGVNFDCASQAEIELVLSTLQVTPARIVYSNPCKQEYGIRHAKQKKIKLTVFDNTDELLKISRVYPDTHLLLRIATDDSDSQCPLSCKFGARFADFLPLLTKAKSLNLSVRGVHFHVGSGCSSRGKFTKALEDARFLFDLGESLGFSMNILNIGGGFPGTIPDAKLKMKKGTVTFEDLASEIRIALDLLFPPSNDLQIMAEPGRYFAAPSSVLATKIYARRSPCELMDENSRTEASLTQNIWANNYIYYINDGVYGSFNNLIFDHASVTPRILLSKDDATAASGLIESAIFGQTCDGFDCVEKRIFLPKLEVGDWLMFEGMGAYTICAASTFNGFDPPTRLHLRILPRQEEVAHLPKTNEAKPSLPKKTLSPCLAGYYQYKQRQQQAKLQSFQCARSALQRHPLMPQKMSMPPLISSFHFDSSTTSGNAEDSVLYSSQKIVDAAEKPATKDNFEVRSPQRSRPAFRPVSVRPLQSTAQKVTSFSRLGGGRVNAKILASVLRTAYCRHRPLPSSIDNQFICYNSAGIVSSC